MAVRMPSDPVAMKLIRMAGVPVAAPSANTSGRPSPTTADHVWEDLNGKIEMIVDGGAVGIGVESTIVDVTGPVPVILRPGFITLEMLQEMFDQVKIDPAILGPMADGVRPKAPGMKYKHYAPLGQLTLVELKEETKKALHTPGSSQWQEVEEAAQKRGISLEHADLESIYMALQTDKLAAEKEKQGAKTGVICTEETEKFYETKLKGRIGQRAQADTVAHNLYRVLRDFDDLQVEYIYSESFAGDHLGQAIMNRLNKAAGYHIIYV